jgi:hypothetical protein
LDFSSIFNPQQRLGIFEALALLRLNALSLDFKACPAFPFGGQEVQALGRGCGGSLRVLEVGSGVFDSTFWVGLAEALPHLHTLCLGKDGMRASAESFSTLSVADIAAYCIERKSRRRLDLIFNMPPSQQPHVELLRSMLAAWDIQHITLHTFAYCRLA